MSIIPPINHIEIMSEAQPGVVSVLKNFANKAYNAMNTEIKQTPKPRHEIIRIGLTLKEVIPSNAKEIIFFSGYFDSPAKRSARS